LASGAIEEYDEVSAGLTPAHTFPSGQGPV
jgi:hypothetical protein